LTKLSYPFPQINAIWVLLAQSAVFVGIENDSNGNCCHFLEVDKDGNILRNHSIHLELTKSPVHILTDNNKQRLFFFQFQKKSNDSLLLKGYLVDVSGLIQKQLAYPIKYDDDLDAEPKLLFDNSGNVHVMILDPITTRILMYLPMILVWITAYLFIAAIQQKLLLPYTWLMRRNNRCRFGSLSDRENFLPKNFPKRKFYFRHLCKS
jgi:hypothetical protein